MPVGRARGPADAEALHLRENEPARLRHARRPREPARPALAPDRTSDHAHPRAHAHPGAPIFRLQGGPGLTNMDFPDAKRFTARHDVVLVGYRGVDGSSRLDCPEVIASTRSLARPAQQGVVRVRRRRLRCLRQAAPGQGRRSRRLLAARARRRPRARTPPARLRTDRPRQRERRHAHGDDLRLALPAEHPPLGDDRRQPARQLPLGREDDRRADPSLRRRSAPRRRTAAAGRPTSPRRSTPPTAKIPSRCWFLPIKKGNVRVAGFFGLINATAGGGGPLAGPKTIDTLLSIDKGDGAGGAWLLSLFAGVVFPRAQVWGDVASVARTDAAYGRRFFASGADRGSVIGSPGTDFIWAGGRLLNAWPANPDENEYTSVRDSNVPTLLIGGQLDFATPPQNAHPRAAAAPPERARRSSCRSSATPTTSGPTSRTRPPG